MVLEKNKDLVRKYFEGMFSRHDLKVADEVFSSNYINHQEYDKNRKDVDRGLEGFKKMAKLFYDGFPDLKATIEDMIAADDKVVTRWVTRGTHSGNFNGIAPTNRKVTIRGITIDRIADGEIVETWTVFNVLDLLQQIGAAGESLKAAA